MSDPLEPFRAEVEAAANALKHYEDVDWSAGVFPPAITPNFNEAVFKQLVARFSRNSKALQIAEGKCPDLPLDEQGPDAALLWKLAN